MNTWDAIVGSILEPVLNLDTRIGAGLEGCSPEEIATIERKFDLTLPPAFVALLARIGRDRGHLLRDAYFGYPEILSFREHAEFALADSGLTLDRHDLVYQMSEGTEFVFLRAETGDDPAVFFCDSDDPMFVALGVSFTGWLQVCMDQEMELWTGALAWEAAGNSLDARLSHQQPKVVPTPWWKLW